MGDAARAGGLVPLTYYLDASIQIDLCRAIGLVRDDIVWPEDPGWRALKDDEWLPLVGFKNWVVLMRDARIRYRTGERTKLMEHGIRAFCFTNAGNYTKWRTLDLMVRRWPQIEAIAQGEPGPYIYSCTQAGCNRLV